MHNHTVYIDTETTGLNPNNDEVVEISILADDGTVLLDSLVKPVKRQRWPKAQSIHNISPKMVAEAPTLEELAPKISELTQSKNIVIYNSDFDLQFIGDYIGKYATIKCCMKRFAKHYGEWNDYQDDYKWKPLNFAADQVRYKPKGDLHRALEDCKATRAIWHHLESSEITNNTKRKSKNPTTVLIVLGLVVFILYLIINL